MFCQSTGYGGTISTDGHDTDKVKDMKAVKERSIRIVFNADTAAQMQWNFRPQQSIIDVSNLNTEYTYSIIAFY